MYYFPASIICYLFEEFCKRHGTKESYYPRDKIWTMTFRGKANASYRIEIYKPDNYPSVHLRAATGKDMWSRPLLYGCHDSCWRQAVEAVFRDTAPLYIDTVGCDGILDMGVDEQEYRKFRSYKDYMHSDWAREAVEKLKNLES